jgi:hypothetical protein
MVIWSYASKHKQMIPHFNFLSVLYESSRREIKNQEMDKIPHLQYN